MIQVDCRVCGQRLQARESHLGRTVTCPGCDSPTLIALPDADDASAGVVLSRRSYEPPPPPPHDSQADAPRPARESNESFPAGSGYIAAAILQLVGAVYFISAQDAEIMNLQATLYAVGLFIGAQLSLCASILVGIRSRIHRE